MKVYNRLLDRLIPDRCAGCGMTALRGLCPGCADELARVDRPCPGCGLARPVPLCPRAAHGWRIDAVIAPYRYAEPLRSYLQALKFSGQRRLGRALGALLADHLDPRLHAVDALVAVPLHRRRFVSRGYNQAMEIARSVSASVGAPLLVRGIARVRPTAAQTGLEAAARRRNLRGAFAVSRELAGLRLAVIDDVMTTGATIDALARELKRAAAASVQAWTVARSV